MDTIESLIAIPQYSLNRAAKRDKLTPVLLDVHQMHFNQSAEYRKLSMELNGGQELADKTLESLPFLPVTAFKHFELRSIPRESVYKVLMSSGTTGQSPSRIFLDQQTARIQNKALFSIMQFILGSERLPMIIVDSDSVFKDKLAYSARGAGIQGMSVFGKNHFYLLDRQMQPKTDEFRQFLQTHGSRNLLIFGFTFMVWQYLLNGDWPFPVDLSQATLIHSGGWKKLESQKVSPETFKQMFLSKFGLKRNYNFYGMVEQVGTIYLECEQGYFHAPNFSEVVFRNVYDFRPMDEPGSEGLIQVISPLPHSYPGHSLLTEDLGRLYGEDDCACGRKGKYFKILGRISQAELRGCSDVLASEL